MLNIVFASVFFYLLIWTLYLGVYTVAGWFYRSKKMLRRVQNNRYAVLVPVYKEDSVILETVVQNLSRNGHNTQWHMFVIADSLEKATLEQLSTMDVTVVEVQFESSTKAKALNEALKVVDSEMYSHTVVLDADNVMDEYFFEKLEAYPNSTLKAAQTRRTAKNQNSTMAILDAINEEIGNHIFRQGHVVLGLSSALIGSGMVFETDLFKSAMEGIRETASEDKMLEFELLSRRIKVKYLSDVLTLDEKVSTANQFEGQRTRWVAARLFYLKSFFVAALVQLIKGNFDFFNKWLQFLLPQKILLIAFTFCLAFISLFVSEWASYGVGLLLFQFAVLAGAVPRAYWTIENLKGVLLIPQVALRMVHLLFKIHRVDTRKFNVTEKGQWAS